MNRIWLNQFEWASNQSIAVSGSYLGPHPAWTVSEHATHTQTQHTEPHVHSPRRMAGFSFLDRRSCAIRKFRVLFVVLDDSLLI